MYKLQDHWTLEEMHSLSKTQEEETSSDHGLVASQETVAEVRDK